jgi:hypothetical protein
VMLQLLQPSSLIAGLKRRIIRNQLIPKREVVQRERHGVVGLVCRECTGWLQPRNGWTSARLAGGSNSAIDRWLP